MIDLLDLRLQGRYLRRCHVFNDYEGKSTFPEFIEELFLPDDRLHVLRQVIEHIVVDSCVDVAEDCRDQKKDRNDQDRNSAFDYCFRKPHFLSPFQGIPSCSGSI